MATVKYKSSQKGGNKTKQMRPVVWIVILVLITIPVVLWAMVHNEKNNLTPYQGSSYIFSYPKNWTVKKTDRSDISGTELFLQPPDAAPPETPYVIVDEAPATKTAVSKLTDPFTIFKYAKTGATVSGIPARKYTNVVHAAEGVFHSTAYVFEAKGNVYLVTLGYKQDKPDTELETEFNQIMDTFLVQ